MANGKEHLVIGTFDSAKVIGGVLCVRLSDRTVGQVPDRYTIEIVNGREALRCLRELRVPDVENDLF